MSSYPFRKSTFSLKFSTLLFILVIFLITDTVSGGTRRQQRQAESDSSAKFSHKQNRQNSQGRGHFGGSQFPGGNSGNKQFFFGGFPGGGGGFPPSPPRKELPNYYRVLGVSKNSDVNQIKQAWRRFNKDLHPDRLKSKGATDAEINDGSQKLREINNAYDVLSDPEKRKIYDLGGDPLNPDAGPPGGGHGGFPFAFHQSHGQPRGGHRTFTFKQGGSRNSGSQNKDDSGGSGFNFPNFFKW